MWCEHLRQSWEQLQLETVHSSWNLPELITFYFEIRTLQTGRTSREDNGGLSQLFDGRRARLMFKSRKANLGSASSLYKTCSHRAKQARPLSFFLFLPPIPLFHYSTHTSRGAVCALSHSKIQITVTLSKKNKKPHSLSSHVSPSSLASGQTLCNKVLKPPKLGDYTASSPAVEEFREDTA